MVARTQRRHHGPHSTHPGWVNIYPGWRPRAAQGAGVAVTVAAGVDVTIAVGVAVTVTVVVGVGVVIAVGVEVGVGVVIAVGVEVGVVVVAVGVGVAVTGAVAVGVAVGVADAVAGADMDGATVAVGDVLGADVFGATVAGEVTCPVFAPVIWGVHAVTVMTPAANKPTSHAVASGRASRRSDWPLRLRDRISAGLKADTSLADVTVLVVLPVPAHSASAEATGPDNWPVPGSIRP
jgi:hypothetical protein